MKRRRQKKLLFMTVLLMMIGFASITTTLVLNGTLNLLGDTTAFNGDVVFTKAKTDAGGMASILEEGKKITFTSKELSKVGEEAILNFEITNKNRQYDAVATINCNTSTEEYADYITITPNKTSYEIEAGKSVAGSLSASLVRGIETEEVTDVAFTCTLNVVASERETVAPMPMSNTLKQTEIEERYVGEGTYIPYTKGEFWDYYETISKIVFEDTMNPHETAEDLIFDVSDIKDGSVMSYLIMNEDNSTYTLYIQSNGKIKANENSSYLFYHFTTLETIEGLEKFDTSNVTNMSSMFTECINLTNLDLSTWDTSNVTNIEQMFSSCTGLTNINISTWDTSNVTSMYATLSGCQSLTNIDISKWDTSKVTDMGQIFSYCRGLTNINISTWDTSNVTNMRYIFSGCSSLTNLDISTWNTSNVTDMIGIFSGCKSLTKINISKWNTSNVVEMDSMFRDCINLTNLDINSWNTSNVTNMSYMFQKCSSLTNLDISKWDTSNVVNMSRMFEDCSSLTNLDISNMDFTNDIDNSINFFRMPNNAQIIVKDETAQQWILIRYTEWTTENVIIKG